MRSLSTLALASALLTLLACPAAKEDKPLPPTGLAGGPGGAGAAGAAPHAPSDPHAGGLALPMPGQGKDGELAYKLPSGHPPVDEMAGGAAGTNRPAAPADAAAGANDVKLTGKVLEVLEVPQYTYMRLSTPGGEVWAAVGKAAVKVGDEVSIAQPMVMENFPSKTLNRSFDKLIMGNLVKPEPKKG